MDRTASSIAELAERPPLRQRPEARAPGPPPAGSPPFRARLAMCREDLENVAGQWNALLEASAANSLFLRWEWIASWLDTVGRDVPIAAVLVQDSTGRLCGIAPFYGTRLELFGLVSFGGLRVLGDRESGADYPDLIVQPGWEQAVLRLIASALVEHTQEWDCIWLPNVSGWTGAAERWQGLGTRDLPHRHARPAEFAAVPLPDSHADFFKRLSTNTRSTLRRQTRRLMSGHRVEVRRCEDQRDIEPMLAGLFELHRRRWQTEGDQGGFVRAPRMAAFYRRFAPAALANGWLRLFALEIDGRVVAVQYGYAYAGVFHQVQEGFDPQGPPGAGNVLRERVFEACIDEGIHEYDFLGTFSEHKRRWGALRRLGWDLLIGQRSLKNQLLFARPVWPTGRFLRPAACNPIKCP